MTSTSNNASSAVSVPAKIAVSCKGFFDLSGELRHRVYAYAQGIEAEQAGNARRRMFVIPHRKNWTGTCALAQANSKARREYRPLYLAAYLANARVELHWCSLPRWLAAFYPTEAGYFNAPREILLLMDGQDPDCGETAPGTACSFGAMPVPQLDILPLLKMKLACPEREVQLCAIRWHDIQHSALLRSLVDDTAPFAGAVERLGAQFEGRGTAFLQHVREGRIARFLIRADIDDLDDYALEEDHVVVVYRRERHPVEVGACAAVRTVVFREVSGEHLFFSRRVLVEGHEWREEYGIRRQWEA